MSLQGFNPGRRDKRVSLFSAIETDNDQGGFDVTWQFVATVWASWAPQPGREVQALEQKLAIGTGTFRIPYRRDITAKFRVVWGSAAYDLIAPPILIGRNYLDLVVQSLEAPGGGVLALGYAAFTVDLDPALGLDTLDVSFPIAFAAPPSTVYVSLVAPTSSASFTLAVRDGSISASGFTVDFGADVPNLGYKMSVIAFA